MTSEQTGEVILNSSSGQQTVLVLAVPNGQQRLAMVNTGFAIKSNSNFGRTCNWALFADRGGTGDVRIINGQVTAPPINSQPAWVAEPGFDPRPYKNNSVVLTLVIEPLEGGVTVSDAVIHMVQSSRT